MFQTNDFVYNPETKTFSAMIDNLHQYYTPGQKTLELKSDSTGVIKTFYLQSYNINLNTDKITEYTYHCDDLLLAIYLKS